MVNSIGLVTLGFCLGMSVSSLIHKKWETAILQFLIALLNLFYIF